jgi:hypothetical protein
MPIGGYHLNETGFEIIAVAASTSFNANLPSEF